MHGVKGMSVVQRHYDQNAPPCSRQKLWLTDLTVFQRILSVRYDRLQLSVCSAPLFGRCLRHSDADFTGSISERQQMNYCSQDHSVHIT